jgi:hypothetical protein
MSSRRRSRIVRTCRKDGMQELADLLAREHVQLEFLLFKTIELHQMLRAGETRFLRWTAAELGRASDRVRECEERRSELVRQRCAEAGIALERASLAELTARAPQPWHTIFSDHSRDMRQLVIEVDSNRQAARTLATASGHSIVDVLDRMYRPAASGVPAQRVLTGRRHVVLPGSSS